MASDPRIGTDIGPYRIEALLGRGGMGVVYVAEHLPLNRKVALKLLAPEIAQEDSFRQRFLRESRLAGNLEHPNVIPVYDAGTIEGLLYIAMRYIRGTDLKTLIEEHGALDKEDVVTILWQVGSALDAAHEQHLVHRDVKPANILLSRQKRGYEGAVYLTDFGLTKRTDSRSRLTKTGMFMGTMDYAAPEQFQGSDYDGRTDVYSLACVAYECLTGEVPYPKDTDSAVMYAHLMEAPPRPTEKRNDVPPAVDDVITKGMSKAKEERYPTCEELVTALRTELGRAPARQSKPTVARRVEETVVAPEPEGAETSAAATGQPQGETVLAPPAREGEAKTSVAPPVEPAGGETSIAPAPREPAAETVLAPPAREPAAGETSIAPPRQLHAETRLAPPARPREPEASIAPPSERPPEAEVEAPVAPPQRPPAPLETPPAEPSRPRRTLALAAAAVVLAAGGIAFFVLAGGDGGESSGSRTGTATDLASSFDQIAFASGDLEGNLDLFTMAGDGTGLKRLTSGPSKENDASWLPDGSQIIFTSDRNGDFDIFTMNPDGSNQKLLIDQAKDVHPVPSPDGRLIAFASDSGDGHDIFVADADGGNVTQLTDEPGKDWMPAWSPDGTKIMFASERDGDFDLYVMNADGSNPEQVTNEPGDDLDPAWLPTEINLFECANEESTVAFASDRDGDLDIYRMRPDGTAVTRLTEDDAPDSDPAWSADGSALSFDSDRNGDSDIFTMSCNGSDETQVTDNDVSDVRSAPSPVTP
jgi:Tol biopolymer transport system component